MIDLAFKKFDKDGSGELTVDDMKNVYSAKNHPLVKNGKEIKILNNL